LKSDNRFVKNRLVRVRELLQRELGAILARDHAFPGVLVTVNGVDVTPDLKHAHVYIGVIGPETESQHVVDTLNRQRGELQTRVSKRVILKNTPHFHFRLDHSIERGVRVTGIMEAIDRQLAESAARDAAAGIAAPAPDSPGPGNEEPMFADDLPDADSATANTDDDDDDVATTGEPARPASRPKSRRRSRNGAPIDDDE
jgi:ribosome-binding factor A